MNVLRKRVFRTLLSLLTGLYLAVSCLCASAAEETTLPEEEPVSVSVQEPDDAFQSTDLITEDTAPLSSQDIIPDSVPEDTLDDYDRALASRNQDRYEEHAVLNAAKISEQNPVRNYTVMIYMIGSNLESQYGSATLDLLEMEEAGLDYTQTNLLVYTGGARMWKGDVPADTNCVLDMALPREERIIASTEKNADMGSPETLSSFVNFCTDHYPAEHNMLLLWNHGGGPLWGYGNDELFGSDSLLLSEMKEAMRDTLFWRSKRLDFVGFDACLMGCYENMAIWRYFADYYIGSEDVEPGDGWDYHFLSILNETDDPARIARAVTSGYYSYYQKKATETFRPQVTLSCTDLSKVPQITAALRALFARMDSGVGTGDYAELSRIRSSTQSFGRVETLSSGVYSYDLVDLRDLVRHLTALYPKECASLTNLLNNFVISRVSSADAAGGISLFYPCENKGQFEKMSSYYKTISISRDYSHFLDSVAAEWRSAKSRDWELGSLTAGDGEFLLQLTEDQLANMSSVYYCVLNAYNSGGYLFILDKCSLIPDADGVVHIPSDPNIFYLDGGGADKTIWNVAQTGRSRTRLYYQTTRTMLYSDANPLEHERDLLTKNISLSFSTNLRGGDLKIGSITATADNFDTLGKETVDLNDWEAVSQSSQQIVPTRDENGRLMPASQWDNNELTSLRIAPYDTSFTFGLSPASVLSESCVCQVVLEDVNGEAYATELCPIRSAAYRPVTVKDGQGAWDFLVYSDHAVLIGYTGAKRALTVPGRVEGLPVTELYSGAFGNFTLYDRYGYSPITSITLPDTMTILHKNAFSHCADLKKIVLPKQLSVIGNHAFSGCSSLEEITLPASVVSIGKSAFDSCTSLKKVTLPPSLEHLECAVFMNCPNLETISGEALSGYRILDGALYDETGTVLLAFPCARTGRYAIPEETRELAYGSLSHSRLSEVILPEGLERIGNYAFYNCDDLAVPVLPDSLAVIDAFAFGAGYENLDPKLITDPVELHIGPNVNKVGADAFTGLGARFFTVSEDNPLFAAAGGHLANKARDTLVALATDRSFSYIIPEGVTSFDWDAFDTFDCYGELLNKSTIHFLFPDSVTQMGGTITSYNGKKMVIHAEPGSAAQLYAQSNRISFSTNRSWKWQVSSFPTEKGTLYARLYEDHASILFYEGADDPLILPDTLNGLPVTVLGGGVFPILMPAVPLGSDYSELGFLPASDGPRPQTVILPDSLTTIASQALNGLGNIPNLELPESVSVIESSALGRKAKENWNLPKSLSYAADGFIYGYTGTFTVSPGLKYVAPGAFRNSSGFEGFVQEGENELYSVREGLLYSADGKTLLCCPSSRIDNGSFTVPEGTETVGALAFSCTAGKLKSVEFPAGISTISEKAFYACYNLKRVSFRETEEKTPLTIGENAFANCSGLAELMLPEGLTSIGASAFSYCLALEDLALPDSLISIGDSAFAGCSSLGNIRFGDHLTYIGTNAFSYCDMLFSVSLPESLVTIGSYAFSYGRYALQEGTPFVLRLGPNVRTIGTQAFLGLPVSAFEVDPDNRFFSTSGPDGTAHVPGLLLSKAGSQLIACPTAAEGEVRVPSTVSMILYAAFYNCDAVTDVFLPASVLSISSYAFQEKYQTVTDPETGRTDWSYYYTLTVHTPDGSNAGSFCITHGIPLTAE